MMRIVITTTGIAIVIMFAVVMVIAVLAVNDYQQYTEYKDTGEQTLRTFCQVFMPTPDHQCIELAHDVIQADNKNGYHIQHCDKLFMDTNGIWDTDSFVRCLAREGIYLP